MPVDQAGGSCFGFKVRSGCAFRFLRTGGGEDTLEIRQNAEPPEAPASSLIAEWVLRDAAADVVTRLYRFNDAFHYWTNDAGWFRIDPPARVIDISTSVEHPIRREQRLWGIPALLCFMERGDFGLHAAAVEVHGHAILLAAPGRHGKTTLAVAFHERGYRLLSEDTSCCRVASHPVLLPGPTSVRLRPDVFNGKAPNGTSIVSVRSDRVHLALDSERAGGSVPVPIKALVFLREPADSISLQRQDPATAVRDLWALNFHLPSTSGRTRSFTHLARLAGSISIWNLYRPLSLDNLDDVIARIVETCG